MSQKSYWVYILTNLSNTVLYVGMTGDIERRIIEHRQKKDSDSFTARYNCCKCIYFEIGNDSYGAIEREKQIKRWSRKKKEALIMSLNPYWNELVQ